MEFFINKDSNLPPLKMELINDGRNDFRMFFEDFGCHFVLILGIIFDDFGRHFVMIWGSCFDDF